MSIPSGSRLGPYELTAPIGAGGMGEVYRAIDARLGREVALKVLPEAFASDPERLARFEREARLLAALNHPGIAHLYGFESVTLDDGVTVHLLAMELVEGEDLSLRLKRGPIPVDEAIGLARQVAEALEEAHEKGIVHRDVKPANLKLTPDGKVKVLDFGLAKAYAGDSADGSSSAELSQSPTLAHTGTATGLILGTAAYMSPEQARGRAVDRRADVWAFGVVLYEMLTGHRLFTGETVSDVLAGVLTRDPDWSLLPGATPAFLRDLLRRCLDRDPRSRLRDIGEARVALERARAAIDVPARRPSRRSWLALLGAALAGGLVVAGAVRLFLPPSGRTPVLRKVDLLAPDLDLDWNIAPALSPDGSRVAWSAAGRVWVRDLDQLEARSVAEIAAPTPLCWSPDSRTVAFGDLKKLWKVPAQGGARTAVADVPGTGQLVGAAWSPGGQIALAAWRGGLYEVSERGGAAALRLDVDERRIDYHYPSWLPNGDLLYLIHWKDRAEPGGRPLTFLAVHDGAREIPVSIDVGGTDAWPTVTPEGLLLFLREGDNAGIWAVPYDVRERRVSGEEFRVAPGGASLSASAEGSLLYVQRAGTEAVNEMAWVDRTGRTIGVVGSSRAGLSGPTLSPDGRRIAFAAGPPKNRDIWVHDLGRGTETRLTFGAEDDLAPTWLSTSEVAYVQMTPATTSVSGRILAVRADGSGAQRVMVPEAALGRATRPLALASDGRTALQIVDERGHGRLRVADVRPDGSLGPLRPILRIEPEPDVGEARLSPDGRLLAYVTDEPGLPELFLTRFPSGEGRWQVTTDGGRGPRWARDTGELLFTTGLRQDELFSVRADPAFDPPIGAPASLFRFGGLDGGRPSSAGGGDMDVAADGQRLLVARPGAGATARRMVLVQGWLAEFRAPGAASAPGR